MEVVDERQARKEVEEEMEIMVRSIMTRGRKYKIAKPQNTCRKRAYF